MAWLLRVAHCIAQGVLCGQTFAVVFKAQGHFACCQLHTTAIHRNCHSSTSETEQVGWEKGTITLLIHEEKCDVCTVQSCRIFTALFQQLCSPANRSNILPVAFIVFSSKMHNKLTHQTIIFQLGESDAYKNYSGVTYRFRCYFTDHLTQRVLIRIILSTGRRNCKKFYTRLYLLSSTLLQ